MASVKKLTAAQIKAIKQYCQDGINVRRDRGRIEAESEIHSNFSNMAILLFACGLINGEQWNDLDTFIWRI